MKKKHMKWFAFLICVMLFCALGTNSVAQAETTTTVQTGAYGEIFNVESGKCLNVRKNSSARDASITIYSQDGTTGQQWQFLVNGADGYLLIPSCAANTGRVINIYGYAAQADSRICLWDATWSDTQTWIVEALEDGSFILRSKNNPEYCLAESGTANSSVITLKAYSATDKSIRWKSSLVTAKTETPEPPKEIKLSATSIETYIHIPIQLTLEGADASKVTWTCSNEKNGYVKEDGVVRALKKNCSFTVTAKYEGKSYKCKITVLKNDPKLITYKEKMYWIKKDAVPVYLGPHSSAPVVKKLDKGTVITITGDIINKAGNNWYLTGEGYYVYGGNCTKVPEVTTITDTVLFAQRKDTGVYGVPSANSEKLDKLRMHSYLTMIGELTDFEGKKWYVTYGSDKTGELRYVRAEDFAATPYLTGVTGCHIHYSEYRRDSLCTFCAVTTLVRRKAVHDGLGEDAVTFDMIRAGKDAWSGGIVYHQKYQTGGGVYETGYFLQPQISSPQFLANLCDDHPEGVVIYDAYHAVHAVCVSHYIILEDGTYQFYVYDTNVANGMTMVRLEDSVLYARNGYNMNVLFQNLSHIIFVQ